jgi:GT2 family glycosyltransferase
VRYDYGARAQPTGPGDHERSPQASGEEPPTRDRVQYSTWLCEDTLLAVGCFPVDEAGTADAVLVVGDREAPVGVRCLAISRAGSRDAASKGRGLVLVRFPYGLQTLEQGASLHIRTPTETLKLAALELLPTLTGLNTLSRESLAPLDAEVRAQVIALLTSALDDRQGETDRRRFSANLFRLREALRERLPYSVVSADTTLGLRIDAIAAVDESSFYIKGWAQDEEARITSLTAVSPEGTRAELSGRLFRFRHPEPDRIYGPCSQSRGEAGFITFFETEKPSELSTGWVVEMRSGFGGGVEAATPPVLRDSPSVLDTILGDLEHERLPAQSLVLDHVHPAVSRLQHRRQAMAELARVVQYGVPAESPDVSIVIRLDRHVDLLEQQLAQFTHDPDIRRADLIYVLDAPRQAHRLLDTAAQLSDLYRIPFRLAVLEGNPGFAAAVNAGASLVRGPRLMLLHSDVLPDKPGWLGRMISFYDATPGIGALGVKLLHEDDSLEHAGIYFVRSEKSSLWERRRCFKGLHRRLPVANVARPVPAVSSACLLVAGELYNRAEGLHSMYLNGADDDTSSDLCLRLIEAGFQNWYLPEAELYHLVERSPHELSRSLSNRYDSWLHTNIWNERLGAAVAKMPMEYWSAIQSAEAASGDAHQ